MLVRQHRRATPTRFKNGKSKHGKQFDQSVSNGEAGAHTVPLVDQRATRRVYDVSLSKPRWWLVLPCLLLITLASAPDTLLINDFIVRRYEHRYGLDSSEKAHQTECRQTSTSTVGYWYLQDYLPSGADYNRVQQDAAEFNIKNALATIIPSLFSVVILGSNCDAIGRRPLLFLPFIGKVIRYSLMLIIITRDLSDTWLLLSHAIEAMFGSVGIVTLSTLAYITDCTHESERTRPFFLTEVITLVARVVPVIALGLWLKRFLYIIPTSVSLALCVIGALYVLFIQPESLQHV
ncbi:unnamed protein product [Rotaria magnacalcarata]|nr:unnamed protein product [Rotaria magnacalcarata]CAF2129842.1 unnamed protein product [Rotaria magnacalcarata]CAF4226754.1 unnamed protein product [Rotaria magnacalcarata]